MSITAPTPANTIPMVLNVPVAVPSNMATMAVKTNMVKRNPCGRMKSKLKFIRAGMTPLAFQTPVSIPIRDTMMTTGTA